MNEVTQHAEVDAIIVEAFYAGERNFFERATALLPILGSEPGIDGRAIATFSRYLRNCERAPARATRIAKLLARVKGGNDAS